MSIIPETIRDYILKKSSRIINFGNYGTGAFFAYIRPFPSLSFGKKTIANRLRLCYNKICMRYVNYIKYIKERKILRCSKAN